MSSSAQSLHVSDGDTPAEGTRRIIDQIERVFYSGYWIKTYPVPKDVLRAKSVLIEALTRRLFNHTEHGLNVPGARLSEARAAFAAETDPARRRVKGAMLAGALVNRATDIFRRLVDLQADAVEIGPDFPLLKECGRCLVEALELGRLVYHRSGEEGIDELWGEPFRVFSVPLEEFFECRYIKTGQAMRDIDRIASCLVDNLSPIPLFTGIEPAVREFALAARVKIETFRSDSDIFEVWSRFVSAGEHLVAFVPNANAADLERPAARSAYAISDGVQLIRCGRSLIVHIARARTSMPKSTREFIERCEFYRLHGRLPALQAPMPM